MDLFAASTPHHTAAVLAAKSLATLGAVLSDQIQTSEYFHATAELDGHTFTIDIVLDQNLHRVGQFHTTASGIMIADLETLLLIGLTNAKPRVTACDFAQMFGVSPTAVLKRIETFRGEFQSELAKYLDASPPTNKDVAALIRKLKRLR